MNAPTARDVARRAGVSLGTVSHAFHYPHKVRPPTLEKVRRAARELGYEPNLAASLLRAGPLQKNAVRKRMSLGFVTAEQTAACREGYTYFMRPVQLRCTELGYGFERVDLNLESTPAAWERMLRARGVAGLILGPMYDPPPLDSVDWDLFSVVRLGRYATVGNFHTVRPSIFPEVMEGWRQLRSRGYERIGACFFQHTPYVVDDDERVGAYFAARAGDPGAVAIPPLVLPAWDPAAFDLWWQKHRPDAVIDFALCTWRHLQREGVEVGKDCGFMTIGGNQGMPQFASFIEDEEGIGRSGVDLCDQLIRHGERGLPNRPSQVSLGCIWTAGETVRPIQEVKA